VRTAILVISTVFLAAVPAWASVREASSVPPTQPVLPDFARLLLALAAIVIVGQILARLMARIHQPPVIGEVAAGILLGPSFIGETASSVILPPSIAPGLMITAQLGVMLYMFLVGLELNLALLKNRTHATLLTAMASIAMPFLMGVALAIVLHPRMASTAVPITGFALFMGVALSITAFPVLARILGDAGLARTRLGTVALSCAAINDVAAWCLLAVVIGAANSDIEASLPVLAGAVAFIAALLAMARPTARIVGAISESDPRLPFVATLVLVALLVSAAITDSIGIHAIFGAFLIGVIVPHECAVARMLTQQLERLVTVLLLPAFFAFSGMRTRIDMIDGSEWLICAGIVAVATIGKIGGTYFAARATGFDRRESAALGALMNTRGLMELIVLNVGLEMGIISPTLYAMMVVMALATTAMTMPLLLLFRIRTAGAS
jgi:Kef-type K+ transport system membrane component KefB